ncbi:hypothetical protein I3843_07G113300 [Carya illinoinensis]|nr:hypothetical protein I3843_07G113300 [Carya illinoinensis]
MGSDSNSAASTSSTSSPSGKRARDPEDEVYVDNLHSHKRYLSEIMASSLNGLTVGDPLPENIMESPARSEIMFYPRDELSLQYSPMSEDLDDTRFCETPINTCLSQPDSVPTSPVSPYRYQRPLGGFSYATSSSSHPSHGYAVPATVTCSQPRQRGSDSEGRFPSSPSDICHSADLRRAALLRSVMRTQPTGPSFHELAFCSGQDPVPNIEAEEPYMKSLVDEREYQIEECSSMGVPDSDFNRERSCRVLNMNVKGNGSGD